jgi:PadR family transcriptional regulator, regulatory protein PadR
MTVPRRPDSHPQTRAVLDLLAHDADRWWYGYDVARRTGLSSGTLYPILARLADRGYLETSWEDDPPEGRPRRHLYRLTAAGAARAAEVLRAATPEVSPKPRPAWGGA